MTVYNHTDIAVGADANAATINSPLGQLDSAMGNLASLTTAAKSSLVAAINELDSAQGNLASLATAAKSSLVAAVNELEQPPGHNHTTGSYALAATESWFIGDCSGGGISVSLPAASAVPGKRILIEKLDATANPLVVAATIEGIVNPQCTNSHDMIELQSDGVNYVFVRYDKTGTNTYNPGPIANGAAGTLTVSVPGAIPGQPATASFSAINAPGWLISACIISANTAAVTIHNMTGSSVDLGSGTVKVRVFMN